MINIANFPSFADAATRYPAYARHMRALHARNVETVRSAVEAGVAVHAGTDAGGFVAHGRVVDEVTAMAQLLGAREAWSPPSHGARSWLGLPSYEPGAPADLVVYADDPGADVRGPAASSPVR